MHSAVTTGGGANPGGGASSDWLAALGFRRVEEVRVFVQAGRAVAEVTAVTHRYPHTFRVSLASATRLARGGVPLRMSTASRRQV